MSQEESEHGEVGERILAAGAALLAEQGPDALTTRAVAAAASVQAPSIYRIFGDKRGLLDAVAEHAITKYVTQKAAKKPDPDPVQDLRTGWDQHVSFGLDNPGLFAIMSGHRGEATRGTALGLDVLKKRIRRIAAAGRLRVSEERALWLLQSTGVGIVQTLLDQPKAQRDLGLSELAREAVIGAICSDALVAPAAGVQGAAIALRASLEDTHVLSKGERHLLLELLERIAAGKR